MFNRNSTEDLPNDPSADYNLDDWKKIVHDEDYIFVALFLKSDGNARKFILRQDNFRKALDIYGPQNLIVQELKIINGDEWLDYQRSKY
ncbi:hypothetical protein [Tetragenococcus halophilus]|uniref:Uncharacterized protein n=1 Tax=Tetragenococcus halophilus (strain DSM 20338 / JCM 20259 / NCIMB 9735 / NBRC 12172) TaxID=945021 RepID=A0AAN1SHK9_TETHN|nr:hypothetical protein [Tetragenococcus halophilus]BAK95168.1 hypothetical protein TEH_18410 [Tetragenococcus halophilus NBRC 12172]GBD71086.1 putative uncharacterized protein [Tetragenococcus halophilus subsp. halophilus]